MKIGILTQPLQTNYGGLLQNYALQQILVRLGHQPETICYENKKEKATLYGRLAGLKKQVMHLLFPGKVAGRKYIPSSVEKSVIRQYTQYFIEKYIIKSRILKTHQDFKIIAKEKQYQGYVVGSDQCWRPKYNRNYQKEMFLSFVENEENIKRVGYAVSFGAPEWEMNIELTKECARLAGNFDVVTVREIDGIRLCKEHLGVDASLVLDPTMLLFAKDYVKLVEEEEEPKSKGNLFYYMLDPDKAKIEAVNTIGSNIGLTPFTVMPMYKSDRITKDVIRNHLEDCIYPSVTKWLRAFMDAEMTIVDSFHGMVFSIIFNKPFWVVGNKKRGLSRFTSLLGLLGLANRLVDVADLKRVDIKQPVDWNSVNEKINIMREQSISVLNESLM